MDIKKICEKLDKFAEDMRDSATEAEYAKMLYEALLHFADELDDLIEKLNYGDD